MKPIAGSSVGKLQRIKVTGALEFGRLHRWSSQLRNLPKGVVGFGLDGCATIGPKLILDVGSSRTLRSLQWLMDNCLYEI